MVACSAKAICSRFAAGNSLKGVKKSIERKKKADSCVKCLKTQQLRRGNCSLRIVSCVGTGLLIAGLDVQRDVAFR